MAKDLLSESIEDFGFPITLAFAKDKRVFLSEKTTGRLWQIDHGEYRLIHTFPVVPILGHNEAGLLGIALDLDFEENEYLYCYYSYGSSDKDIHNRVVKIKADGSGEEVILDALPGGLIHNGGILAFAPDGKLYIGIGVQDEIMKKAQDINWLGGKVLCINKDGTIPVDNPFAIPCLLIL